MAYARIGEEGSDVYVVKMDRYECIHRDHSAKVFTDPPSLLKHLEEEHVACGEHVPNSCLERLQAEIAGRDPMAYGEGLVADAKKELGIKD